MTTQKHTPGPWENVSEPPKRGARPMAMVRTPSGRQCIDCTGSGNDSAEDMANAALIAAAPELLEALRAIVPILDKAWGYDGDVFGKMHNAATDADAAVRAAIARAEGRS